MRTLPRIKKIGILSSAEYLGYVFILQFLKGTHEFRKSSIQNISA